MKKWVPKPYSEVKINDIAYSSEFPEEYQGRVLWKGSVEELKVSEYARLMGDWEGGEEAMKEYDLVVITSEWGPTLCNYDNDPCGVVCRAPEQGVKMLIILY